MGEAMAVPPTPPSVYQNEVWEEFRRVAAIDPRLREVNVHTEMVTGDPVTEILQAAREHGCDLIVMSTHGRTGLARLLMGSVAEQVLRRAPCPVLTVKGAPAGQAEEATHAEEAAAV
jgi:nucleotide-binding universal stress UspA family protein